VQRLKQFRLIGFDRYHIVIAIINDLVNRFF
jgi:hypothetical protein